MSRSAAFAPLALLAATTAVAGCIDDLDPPADLGEDRRAIVGGTINRGDDAVVALLAIYPGGGTSLCSGTLIAPDVVLTAAHCLNGQQPESRVAFFGTDLTQGQNDPDFIATIEAVDAVYNVNFDEDALEAGNDIGMVRLASPAPVTPVPLNTMPTTSLIGSPIRLAGFGRIEPVPRDGLADDGGAAGIKRQVTSTIRPFSEAFQVNADPPDLIAYGSSTQNTCQGDSGGPNFVTIGGVEYVAGVTSFGDIGCAAAGAGTRVDRHLTFIRSFVGGAAAACIDDGICESSCANLDPDCAADPCAADGVCGDSCGAQDADCQAASGGEKLSAVRGGCSAGATTAAPWWLMASLAALALLLRGRAPVAARSRRRSSAGR